MIIKKIRKFKYIPFLYNYVIKMEDGDILVNTKNKYTLTIEKGCVVECNNAFFEKNTLKNMEIILR